MAQGAERDLSLKLRQRAEDLAAALPPLLVAAERVASTVAQGVHGRRRVGTGETFWQFRRYGEGDPASAIDWRRSAKSEHLYVRENEWEAAQTVWLWRDASASMDYRSAQAPVSKAERATLLTLTLAVLLTRGGERVALVGEGIPPGSGRATVNRIAEQLMRPHPPDGHAGPPSLPPAQHLPRHAEMVLIGDFLSPIDEVAAAVRVHAERGIVGHIVQVLDPAEEDLPFKGRTEFEGIEEDMRLVVGKAEALRDAYHERLERHRNALRSLARAHGWSFVGHRTDHAPETIVLALYAALSGQPDVAARTSSRPAVSGTATG